MPPSRCATFGASFSSTALYAALSDRDVLPVIKLVVGLIVPPVSHICVCALADLTRQVIVCKVRLSTAVRSNCWQLQCHMVCLMPAAWLRMLLQANMTLHARKH